MGEKNDLNLISSSQPSGGRNSVTSPPTLNQTSLLSCSRELAKLAKMYTDDSKYSDGDDSFDLKLQIFYDLYRKSGLAYQNYGDAFSTMLRSKARDFYYTKISGLIYDLEVMKLMSGDIQW